MRTPIAICNILHRPYRSLVAMGGLALALLFVFAQLGIYDALSICTINVYRSLQFDVALVSSQYISLLNPGSVRLARLHQALDNTEVEHAAPLMTCFGLFRNPETRRRYQMLVLGIRVDDQPFSDPEIRRQLPLLHSEHTALVDRLSRREIGLPKGQHATEVEKKNLRVVGHYSMGTGFLAGAGMIVSHTDFAAIFHGAPGRMGRVGLLRLRSGADPEAVAASLNQRLGPDVVAMSRRQIEANDQRYMLGHRPIGIMFFGGVLLGGMVAAVTLYQTLATTIHRRLHEFATLRAMGHSDGYLARLVFEEGFLMMGVAYVAALLISLGLYAFLAARAEIPMRMTFARVSGVFTFCMVMAAVVSFTVSRKLRHACPAELFH